MKRKKAVRRPPGKVDLLAAEVRRLAREVKALGGPPQNGTRDALETLCERLERIEANVHQLVLSDSERAVDEARIKREYADVFDNNSGIVL